MAPYLISCWRFQPFGDVIPPRHVLNSTLRTGKCDAGMSGGCIWKPFEIAEDEYAELVEELITLPDRSITIDTRFSECVDFKEWHRKLYEERLGNTPGVTRTPSGGWRRNYPPS
jgi:hypothetical protein